MTKQEAKELTLEVWQFLEYHPDIEYKHDLPDYLWDKIKYLKDRCPLCSLYMGTDIYRDTCPECPLVSCVVAGSAFHRWNNAEDYICVKNPDPRTIRAEAAREIVDKVEAWEV